MQLLELGRDHAEVVTTITDLIISGLHYEISIYFSDLQLINSCDSGKFQQSLRERRELLLEQKKGE